MVMRMKTMFVISDRAYDDLPVYGQVFHDAGFRLVDTKDQEDLLICDGALLYCTEDTLNDPECRKLIDFCINRKIPVLGIQNHGLEMPEGLMFTDASKVTMAEWQAVFAPVPKPEEPKAFRLAVNAAMVLLCVFLLGLFVSSMVRNFQQPAGIVETEEDVTETMLKRYGDSAAQIYTIESFGNSVWRGSGYAVQKDGYILTNAHVTDHPSSSYRIAYRSSVYPAQLIASDPSRDLSLLKIETAVQPLHFAKSEPEQNTIIYMIGWPKNGAKGCFAGTYDGSEVSDSRLRFKVIQMQMYHGISGSCVLNEKPANKKSRVN